MATSLKKKSTKFTFLRCAREFCVIHVHFQSTRSFPCTRTLTVHIANKMKQFFNKLSTSIVVSNNNKLLNPCTVHYKLVINFIPEKNISIMCVLFSSFFSILFVFTRYLPKSVSSCLMVKAVFYSYH